MGSIPRYQYNLSPAELRGLAAPVEVRTSVVPANPGWYLVFWNRWEEPGPDGGEPYIEKMEVGAYPIAAWLAIMDPPTESQPSPSPSMIPLVNSGINEEYDYVWAEDQNSVGGGDETKWIIHESQVDPDWLKKACRARGLDDLLESERQRLIKKRDNERQAAIAARKEIG